MTSWNDFFRLGLWLYPGHIVLDCPINSLAVLNMKAAGHDSQEMTLSKNTFCCSDQVEKHTRIGVFYVDDWWKLELYLVKSAKHCNLLKLRLDAQIPDLHMFFVYMCCQHHC